MTTETRLTPLTMAIYTATYPERELAAVAADHLAEAWAVPTAVLPTWHGFVLYDLTEGDEHDTLREAAVYVAEPPLRVV